MAMDELDLVAKSQKGDFEAFGALYDAYLPKIYRFLFFRLRHQETAEDLTSQTFMKALERIGSFDPERGNFSSWLYQIARNTMVDHLRANKQVVELDEAVSVASGQNVQEEAADIWDVARVKAELQNLPVQQQEVLLLRVFEGYSHREIAATLGISEGASKVNLSRAIDALQKLLGLFLLSFGIS